MRLHGHLCAYISSFILLLSSCGNSNKVDSENAADSLIEAEAAVIPVRDININGKWESKDNPFYPELEFKGKSTVMINTILGPLASGYERDEEFVRVRTDQSDLLFEIISEDSLVGSGFAKGIWIRVK